jgi:hypothetical protein
MARRSKKSIAEILTPSTSLSPVDLAAKVHTSSSPPSLRNNDDVNFAVARLERKISLATEGFTTHKFCELILRDRSGLTAIIQSDQFYLDSSNGYSIEMLVVILINDMSYL